MKKSDIIPSGIAIGLIGFMIYLVMTAIGGAFGEYQARTLPSSYKTFPDEIKTWEKPVASKGTTGFGYWDRKRERGR